MEGDQVIIDLNRSLSTTYIIKGKKTEENSYRFFMIWKC